MSALIRLLFSVLMLGLFITGVFYVVANFLSGLAFNPASRAWRELVQKLRTRNRIRAGQTLMPLNTETLSHLSLKPKILKKAGWRDGIFEGVFSTIYQEPVAVFAGQKSGKTSAVVVQAADREFIIRQKGKETEVWLNGDPYAVLVDGVLLSAGRQGKMLAKMDLDTDLRQWPVIIGQGESATLTNLERAVSPIPRAVGLLRPLSAEEEQALLVLAIIEGKKMV
ncbi:MAG TPA: hypothetical protein VK168_00075 [Saprospiraceae bacterium]|nr:hypothetical protein [Saprospiraceae bacterium]